MTIQVAAGGGKPELIANTPLGLFIPGGVSIDVDGAATQKLDIETCDRDGCYASIPVSDGILSAMLKGKKFNMSFQSMNKQTVTLPMPLTGFATAYQKVK